MPTFSGSMRSQLAFPYNKQLLNTANNFGAQFAQHSQQFSAKSFGLPLPPGGEKYMDHPNAKFMPYFGFNLKAFEKPAEFSLQRETLNLPEAFRGSNEYIDTMLINMISKADMWPIREMMPWKENNESMSISWHIWKFNDHLLNRTPEQSVSRLLTQTYDEKTDTMVRFGIAMLLEHGFMKTPKGVANYFANLQQIRNATLETLMLGAQEAVLYVDRSGWLHNSEGTINTVDDQLMAEEREKRFWGIVQKTQNGFWLCLDDLKEEFSRVNHGEPDYLIVGQGVMKYAATTNMSGVFLMGQRTSLPVKERVNGLTVREWRPARIGDNQPNLDISKINAVIGSFVPVKNTHLTNVRPEEWKTKFMNVRTHDEKADDYFWIDYARLHMLSGLFQRNKDSSRPMEGFGGPFNPSGSYLSRENKANAKASPSRYTLTRAGYEFFEGCASWGEYMEQHGLLRNWIRSFMVKSKNDQGEFFFDIAKRPFPGPSKDLLATATNASILYEDRELLARLGELMAQQVADNKQLNDAKALYEAWKVKLAEWMESGTAQMKIFAKVLAAVWKYDKPTWANLPKPPEHGYDTMSAAANNLNRVLRESYPDRNQDQRLMFLGMLATGGGQFTAIVCPTRIDMHFLGEPNEAKATAAKEIRQRAALDGLFAALTIHNVSDAVIEAKYDDVKAIEVPPSINKFYSSAQKELLAPAVTWAAITGVIDHKYRAAIALAFQDKLSTGNAFQVPAMQGKLDAFERKRVQQVHEESKSSGPMPADLPQLSPAVRNAIGTESQFFKQHEATLRAIYSRRGPHNPVSDRATFRNDEEFIAIIKATQSAAETFKDMHDREVAVSLFFNELYYAALDSVPAVLRPHLGNEVLLKADIAGGMARLLLLYRQVGSVMTDILADMNQDSLHALAQMEERVSRKPSERKAPLADREERAAKNERREDAKAVGSPELSPADVEDLLYGIEISNADIVFWGLEHDCWPLIFFNVLAPSMEYITSPMVLMAAYGAAGYTFHGFHSFELGDDATLKIHYGHFTLYARTIVTNDSVICIRPHAFVHRYVSGNDNTFWDPLDSRDLHDWRNGVHAKSRIVQPYFPDDEEALNAWRINITGFEHPEMRARSNKPVPLTAPVTSRLWGFKHPVKAYVQKPYVESMHDYATVCYQAHYQGCKYIGGGQYDEHGVTFTDKGHWGSDNGYPGCGGVRSGKRMWMERPNFHPLSQRANVMSTGFAAGVS